MRRSPGRAFRVMAVLGAVACGAFLRTAPVEACQLTRQDWELGRIAPPVSAWVDVPTDTAIRFELLQISDQFMLPEPGDLRVVCDGSEVDGSWTFGSWAPGSRWEHEDHHFTYYPSGDRFTYQHNAASLHFVPTGTLPPLAACEVILDAAPPADYLLHEYPWTIFGFSTGSAATGGSAPTLPAGMAWKAEETFWQTSSCSSADYCSPCARGPIEGGRWGVVVSWPLPPGWESGALSLDRAIVVQAAQSASELDDATPRAIWSELVMRGDRDAVIIPLFPRDWGPACFRLWMEDGAGRSTERVEQCFDPGLDVEWDDGGCTTAGAAPGGLVLALIGGMLLLWLRRSRRSRLRRA